MKKNRILNIGIFAALTINLINAHAGEARATVTVTASVISSCSIETENIDFGTYEPNKSDAKAATGAINLTCVKGSAPVVSIGAGSNFDGSNRRAVYTSIDTNGQNQNEYLTYGLYQPVSNLADAACPASVSSAKTWSSTIDASDPSNSTVFAPTVAPSNVSRRYKICGIMNGNQDVGPGTYTDTVFVTASF
jgi:spore coat protein U-like protein